MVESSPKGLKTLLEKEKLLITSNFSFSHSVFKRRVLQTRKNQGLFGKGLKGFFSRVIKTFSMRLKKNLPFFFPFHFIGDLTFSCLSRSTILCCFFYVVPG